MATNFTLNEISSIRLKEQDYHLKNIAFHGTAAEWANHADYVPKAGEIIVYDAATGEEEAKIKVGDGTTVVGELSFITDICARADLLKKKPGRLVEGEELTYTDYSNGGVETIATAETGAEIFNDLNNNAAIGEYSHAEGERTVAINTCAHAEGCYTMAKGSASHAEGIMTRASGQGSHAEGEGTVAVHTRYGPQHVQGKYNVIDTSGIYAHIVGGGSEDEPRNIHTVDYDGIGWYPNIYLGGNDEHTATIKGFYVHNSTTSLPTTVIDGAILIAYDE